MPVAWSVWWPIRTRDRQFTSVRFTERLDEIGATPSIGTVADSFDNALAEAINGLSKTECVYGPDTNGWEDVSHLELATLSWVHWFNEERLHGYCGDVPPGGVRSSVLRWPPTCPTGAWKPIARVSIRPRTIQFTEACGHRSPSGSARRNTPRVTSSP